VGKCRIVLGVFALAMCALVAVAAAGAPAEASALPAGKVAFTQSTSEGFSQLWTINADGSDATLIQPFTNDGATVGSVISGLTWSPDGTRIAFVWVSVALQTGAVTYSLVTVAADGSDRVSIPLPDGEFVPASPAWSPDGTRIALYLLGTDSDGGLSGNGAVAIVPVNGSGAVVQTSPMPQLGLFVSGYLGGAVDAPAWSPDGSAVAATVTVPDQDLYKVSIGILRADGSLWSVFPLLEPVDTWPTTQLNPHWLDSSRLAVERRTDSFGHCQDAVQLLSVWAVDVDGANAAPIASGLGESCAPNNLIGWEPSPKLAPDRSKILTTTAYRWSDTIWHYTDPDLVVMDANGSNLQPVTSPFFGSASATHLYASCYGWSSDSTHAIWTDHQGSSSVTRSVLRVRPVDGSAPTADVVEFTDGSTVGCPVWQPFAAPANQAPSAGFTATPISGTAPLGVGFDASISGDSDGTIVSYDWDFGDSGTGSGVTASHTYSAAGSYTATLTVTDDDGATATAAQPIEIAPPPPMQDHVTVNVTGQISYSVSADLTGGNLETTRTSSGTVTRISGTGTYAGVNGGTATISVDTRRFWILPIYVGSASISDPGAAFNISYPILFGRLSESPAGESVSQQWADLSHWPWRGYLSTVTVDDVT